MGSDGSTSMATVCGGMLSNSLLFVSYISNPFHVVGHNGDFLFCFICVGSMALMDAGIPLRAHVAGLSVGLVTEVDSSTGTVNEYRILTDILVSIHLC